MKRSRSGVALITSLAVVVVVAMLVLGSIVTTQVELAVTRNDNAATQAQYVAQAGLQTYKAALFQAFRWLEGGASGGTILDACTISLAGGIDFLRGSGTTYQWENNRIVVPQGTVDDAFGDPIGTFDVTLIRDPNNASRITVRSTGRTLAQAEGARATATASATFLIRNSSALEQAIFASGGSGMTFINGNSRVYGGIYVVGDDGEYKSEDNLRDRDKTWVIDSNGNFSVRNSYDFSGGGRNMYIVDEALVSSNLCAAFRVENGRVELGGSTSLGTADSPLLAVAVGRGLGTRTPQGNRSYDRDIVMSGAATVYACGQVPDEEDLCAEGRVGPFDLDPESAPVFPWLDESPNTEFCEDPDTWRMCIHDEAEADGLTVRVDAVDGLVFESATGWEPSQACEDLLAAAADSSSREVLFDGSAIDCTAVADNGRRIGFSYNPLSTPASLEVFGNLNFRGLDLTFARDVGFVAHSRSAVGAHQQFAGLSVEKDEAEREADEDTARGGNFTTWGNFVAGGPRFPENVLTIVAEGDVVLGSNKNPTIVTAPIYTAQQFRLSSQTQLFGQIIADQFCTTPPGNTGACGNAGSPSEIIFVPSGENRPRSFRAIAPTGGLPTFRVESFELR